MGWFDRMPNSDNLNEEHRCAGIRWLRLKVALRFLSKVRQRGRVVGSRSNYSGWATLAIVIRVLLRLKRRGSAACTTTGSTPLVPTDFEAIEKLNSTSPLQLRVAPDWQKCRPIRPLLIDTIGCQHDEKADGDDKDSPAFDHIKAADSPGLSTSRAPPQPAAVTFFYAITPAQRLSRWERLRRSRLVGPTVTAAIFVLVILILVSFALVDYTDLLARCQLNGTDIKCRMAPTSVISSQKKRAYVG